MKITQKIRNKLDKKVADILSPIINKFLNAAHQVAIENGCSLTFDDFAEKIRDLLKQTEKIEEEK